MATKSNKPAKKTANKTAKRTLAQKAVKKASSKSPAKKTAKKSSPKKAVAKKPAAKKSVKSPAKKSAVKSSPKKGIAKASAATQRSTRTESSSKSRGIAGKTFLFTGTLTGMQRKEAEALVKENGGSILSGVSEKLNCLVVGEDAGSKLAKAKALKTIKILNENEFLKMVSSENSNASRETPAPSKSVMTMKATKLKFIVSGDGIELASADLTDNQFNYWKERYDKADGEYEATRELIDHIRHHEGPGEGEAGFIGDSNYNYNDWLTELYPSYSGVLAIYLYGGKASDELIEKIEVPLDDSRLKKTLWEENVDNSISKKKLTGGTVFTKTMDSGSYFLGELDISDQDDIFSIDNIELFLEIVQGDKYVSSIEYDGQSLGYEKSSDTENYDFKAWIVWK